jgi:hypothetical protein
MIMALKDAVRKSHSSVPSRAMISNRTAQIRTVWTESERKHRAELGILLQLQLLAKCGEDASVGKKQAG